jgi:hypothetical protein
VTTHTYVISSEHAQSTCRGQRLWVGATPIDTRHAHVRTICFKQYNLNFDKMSDPGSGGRLLAARCSICLLSTFIVIATSAAAVRSRSPCINSVNSATPGDAVEFLGFIPTCHLSSQPTSSLNRSSLSRSEAREILERCDVLVQAAVELAVERINDSPDIPAVNTTLQLRHLLPDTSVVRHSLPF